MLFSFLQTLAIALTATTFVSAAAVDVTKRDNHLLVGRTSPSKDNCKCKDVQSVDKVLSTYPKATEFCSSYLGIKSRCTSTVTAIATTTKVTTATITTTSAVIVSTTATTTTVLTSVDSVSSTSTQTITPPAVTSTITTSETISETAVVTSTSTSTICTGIGVMRREAEPTSVAALEERNSNCPTPPALKKFAPGLVKDACKCYLDHHPITRTVTITKTATSTSSTTKVVPSTTTSVVSTATVTLTVQQTTSILSTETTSLDPSTVTTTVTVSTTTTSTTTVVVPTTTSIIGTYSQAYSNSGCVYNEYTDYYVLQAPNFNDAQQQCACKCNQNSSCKSFFIYYSPPSGRFGEEYDCTLDNVPFNSAFVQCNVYFAAQGKAYNKVIAG